MNTTHKTGLAIGGAVIGIGAAFGVGYTLSGAAAAAQAQAQPGQEAAQAGGSAGPADGSAAQDGREGDPSAFAAALAEKLGVDQDAVVTALREAMQANRSGADASPGAKPSDAPSAPGGQGGSGQDHDGQDGSGQGSDRPAAVGQRGGDPSEDSGRDDQLAASLAERLDLDQATVAKAIEEVRAEQHADRPSGDASGAPEPSASPTA